MKKPFDLNSRDSLKSLEDFCFWIGIGFFFVCALFGFANQSAVCSYISGSAFIVGLVIEVASWLCAKRIEGIDEEATARRERESEEKDKKHQNEMAAVKLDAERAIEVITDTARRTARIEHQHAQRFVTPETRKKMIGPLSQFSKQIFQVIWSDGDTEAKNCGASLAHALVNCGWVYDPSPACYPNPAIGCVFDGTLVLANSEDCADDDSPTNKAINEFGKFFSISLFQKRDDVARGKIVFLIPPKPPAPQDMDDVIKKVLSPSPFTNVLLDIHSRLTEYAGQPVEIESPFNDEIADKVSTDIYMALRMAQWEVLTPPGTHKHYQADFENVRIGVSKEDDREADKIPRAAWALLNELKKLGIVPESEQLRVFDGLAPGRICVRIGLSPGPIKPNDPASVVQA